MKEKHLLILILIAFAGGALVLLVNENYRIEKNLMGNSDYCPDIEISEEEVKEESERRNRSSESENYEETIDDTDEDNPNLRYY